MLGNIVGELRQPVGCADHPLQLRPGGDELRRRFIFFVLQDFLDLCELLGILDLDRNLSRLVEDRDSRPVLLGLSHAVDRDVVAEDESCGAVRLLDGRAGETNPGRVRKRDGDVLSEARVLRAVGLVGHHDHVAPLSERRHLVAPRRGRELLDRREDDPSRGSCPEQLVEALGAAHDLLGLLAHGRQVGAGERVCELVVEVGPIGHSDDGRVLRSRGSRLQLVDEEDHRVALAGPLGVPDEAAPAVPVHCLGHRLNGGVDRVNLVVLGEDLPGLRPVGLEEDEVADQLEEASW